MKRMFSHAAIVAVFVALVVLSGCRSANPQVSITKSGFTPNQLTVNAGDKVTWTNTDKNSHNVTSPAFDSGTVYSGATFSYTFKEAGTYKVICRYHPKETIEVTVR